MTGARLTGPIPAELRGATRDSELAAAERRWENEGGRLPAAARSGRPEAPVPAGRTPQASSRP